MVVLFRTSFRIIKIITHIEKKIKLQKFMVVEKMSLF